MPSSVATNKILLETLTLLAYEVSIFPKNVASTPVKSYNKIPSCPTDKANSPLS